MSPASMGWLDQLLILQMVLIYPSFIFGRVYEDGEMHYKTP